MTPERSYRPRVNPGLFERLFGWRGREVALQRRRHGGQGGSLTLQRAAEGTKRPVRLGAEAFLARRGGEAHEILRGGAVARRRGAVELVLGAGEEFLMIVG